MFGFFLDKDLISDNQSSFKPGGSYINQLLLITHNIYESFVDGYEFRGVFLDISKAFDKLWHDDLIFKLEDNGISGILRNWDQIYDFSTTSLELNFWRIGMYSLFLKRVVQHLPCLLLAGLVY